MNADPYVLRSLEVLLRVNDAHTLADILKLCAAEIESRSLLGAREVRDVAYAIHSHTAHANIAAGVARYLGSSPSS